MSLLSRLSAGWKPWLLLAALTFIAAAPGIFFVPALDRDESRFAQASKQMLETGDFIEIRYQNEGRNKKPAGIHWLQAGSTELLAGDIRNQIWSYRVPSLVGGILATLAVFWCGIVLVGRRSGFLGAALFGSGLLLTSEAHIAKTDAVLVSLTALAMGALARIYMHTRGQYRSRLPVFWLMVMFWVTLAAGFLIKGPVTVLVAGLASLALLVAERIGTGKIGGWAKPLYDWRGLVIFAAIVLPWFIAVQFATSGEFLDGAVGKDLKDKLVGASEGHGGLPGYHLLFVVTHFFPATLFVIPALVLALRTVRGRALDVLAAERSGLIFLLAWLVPTWMFFELLPTKLSHYILPAYPALALITGWGCVQLMGTGRASVSRYVSLAVFGLGGLGLAAFVSPLAVDAMQLEAARDFQAAVSDSEVLAQWSELAPMGLHWLIAACMAILAATGCGLWRRYGASLTLGIVASLCLGWHIRTIFLPGAVWAQPTQSARTALAETCSLKTYDLLYRKNCPTPFPERVQAVGYAEPSLVFTTGTRTSLPPQTQIGLPETEAGYPVAYLLNLEDVAGREADALVTQLAKTAGRELTRSEPRYALNYSNGDPVAFVAIRID